MASIAALAVLGGVSPLVGQDHISPGPSRGDGGECALHAEAAGAGDSSVPGPLAEPAAVGAAFDFLKAQMDRYHRSLSVHAGDGFSAYYPGGRIGDVDDITVVPITAHADGGRRPLLRIDYRPQRSGGLGWAGVYFLYPDGNWGQAPGRNLTGATWLTFSACADRETVAEFFLGGIRDSRLRYADSLPKLSTGAVPVGPTWRRHAIDLRGADLSSVIGGFALAVSRAQDSGARSILLDDITFDLPQLDAPRFVQSYLPSGDCRGGLPTIAQTYDQALVLLAFLARGEPDDLWRAELIARALVEAQGRDRSFQDGRLRNAYASGELIDPATGTARLPGAYDSAAKAYLEDENAAGSDSGNMAWAALALVQAHALLPRRDGDPYLATAATLARWIVTTTRVEDQLGGFSAGVQGFERADGIPAGQERKDYRSTEHNIDLAVLFEHLAAASGLDESSYWRAQSAHARAFVAGMRSEAADAVHYWTGTGAGAGAAINKSVVPLDVQTWAVLGARDPGGQPGALDWALARCRETGSRDTFDFNCDDGDGAWWEGTAQVAAALTWLGREGEAGPVLARLRAAQRHGGPASGALPAASRCGLTTGFKQRYRSGEVLPWLYTDWPHLGATTWFIFAALGRNPYFVADGARPR